MLNKELLNSGMVNSVTIEDLDDQFGGLSKQDCKLMSAACAGQAVTYVIHNLLNQMGGDSSEPDGCYAIVKKYC